MIQIMSIQERAPEH